MTHWAIADRRRLARRSSVTLVTQSSSCASREAADHQSRHAATSRRKSGGLPQLWRDAASACNQLIKYQLELWQRIVETWSECRHSVLDVAFDQWQKRLRMYVTAENAANFNKDREMPSVGSPNTCHKSKMADGHHLEKISKNRHISATFWPIATKCGTVTQFYALDPFDR